MFFHQTVARRNDPVDGPPECRSDSSQRRLGHDSVQLVMGGFAIFWLLGASGIGNFWTNRPDKTFQWLGVIWGTPFVLSIHDLGPLCLQLLEETANLLRAHHTAGAHSCKWFQGPHSIKCLLREHDDHRQVGSPRRHW